MPPAKRGLAADTPSPAGSLTEPPEGIAWIPWLDVLAPPPIPEISDATAPIGVHWRPPEIGGGQVSGDVGVDNPPTRTPRHRRRIEVLAFAAALVLLVGGAIAGADIVSGSGDQHPTLASAITYRDTGAGFALRSPTDWRVIQRHAGTGIRFAIGAAGAPTTETNTVSVSVGTTAAALPELHTLADQLTERLREELPDLRLEEAGRAQIAGAQGLRFAFIDPTVPETRIEQYVGRTTAGRPLTITVTVREPRTAPTPTELDAFLASVKPI